MFQHQLRTWQFSSPPKSTPPHTNKTQVTESVLHRNQHTVTYRSKNHKTVSLQSEALSCGSGKRPGHSQAGLGGRVLHLKPFNFRNVSKKT